MNKYDIAYKEIDKLLEFFFNNQDAGLEEIEEDEYNDILENNIDDEDDYNMGFGIALDYHTITIMAVMGQFYDTAKYNLRRAIETAYKVLEKRYEHQAVLNKNPIRNRKKIKENLVRIDETISTLSFIKVIVKSILQGDCL